MVTVLAWRLDAAPAVAAEALRFCRRTLAWPFRLCAPALLVCALHVHAHAQGLVQRERLAEPWEPQASWRMHPSAEKPGACRDDLDAVTLQLRRLDTTALMAAQGGRVLLRYGPVGEVSQVFSVRKSLLAMLYGPHVQRGGVDLNATLAELGVDDVGGLLPVERTARLVDLLEARSGIFHAAANGGDDAAAAPARGSVMPGQYFLYNNWDFNAAGSIFEQLTARGIHDAFQHQLALPLRLEDFDRAQHRKSGDARRSRHLAYPFLLSTRDMARLGHLMLRRGLWDGQQLLPNEWVSEMTYPRTASRDMHPTAAALRGLAYGRMWWVLEEGRPSPLAGAYLAWGVHGQFILVVPERDLVVAHKRRVPDGGSWNVSLVTLPQFLDVARRLAAVRCLGTP